MAKRKLPPALRQNAGKMRAGELPRQKRKAKVKAKRKAKG